MLGLASPSLLTFPIPPPLHTTCFFPSSSFFNQKSPKSLVLVLASNGDNNPTPDSNTDGGGGEEKSGPDGGDEPKRDGRPLLNIRWGDLLNPDPDNIIAVGLTGVLTWASVQVVGQLFFIALAILVAALKYSFIAALLLFILITLL